MGKNNISEHYSTKKVGAALLHFFVGRAASAILSIITIILLMRTLTQLDFGAYMALVGLQGVVLLVATVGLDAAVERFIPEIRVTQTTGLLRKVVIWSFFIRSLILIAASAILMLLREPLLEVLNLEDWSYIYNIYILTLLAVGLYHILVNVLDSLLMQKWSQLAGFVHVAMRLLIMVVALKYGNLDLRVVFLAELASTLICVTLMAFVITQYLNTSLNEILPQQIIDPNMVKRARRFAFFNYGARIMRQSQGVHGLKLIVSSQLGPVASANFGFVMNWIEQLQRYLPTTLLVGLLRPVFVSRYTANHDFSQLNAFSTLLLKINLLILLPAIALAMAYGNEFAQLVAGDKYADTRWLLVMALCLLVPLSHSHLLGLIANTLEKNFMQFAGGLFSIFGMTAGIYSAGTFGVMGVLAVAVTAEVLYNIYCIITLRRLGFRYSLDIRMFSVIMLAVMVAVGIAWIAYFYLQNIHFSGLFAVLSMLFYVQLMHWVRPFSPDDYRLLSGVLPRKVLYLLKWFSKRSAFAQSGN